MASFSLVSRDYILKLLYMIDESILCIQNCIKFLSMKFKKLVLMVAVLVSENQALIKTKVTTFQTFLLKIKHQ